MYWRSVFKGNIGNNNQIQRSSSTNSNINLINDCIENGTKFNNNEKQNYFISNSNHKLRTQDQQSFENQQKQLEDDQDNLSIKSTLIESKKKLAKKLHNIKLKTQTQPPEKIKRRVYEEFECAILLNDCNKMLTILKENPKLNLGHYLRPDGNTFLHTAVRYQKKDALSFLASRCRSEILNRQNTMGNSALHLAVTIQSPILVNILLNHKACNHVQNLQKETPLILALNLYIKYRNLKDYACSNDHSNSLEKNQNSQHACNCQKRKKLYNLVQFEINKNNLTNLKNKTNDKFNLNHQFIEKENNPNNLNKKLISQLDNLNRFNDSTLNTNQNIDSNQSCCNFDNNKLATNQLLNKKDIETINNCRVMRKILTDILHDSEASSWQIKNNRGETVITLAKQHQVDFVYDFILNYQKLTEIIKPDQNGNTLNTNDILNHYHNELLFQNNSIAATVFSTNGQKIKEINDNFASNLIKEVDELEEDDEEIAVKKITNAANEIILDNKNNEIESTTLIETKIKSNTIVNLKNQPTTEIDILNNEYFRRNQNKSTFYQSNNISTYINNNNSKFINHYKRKTDDQHQYCLKEQRSIIKQDNLNKSTKHNLIPSINSTRKSIRSRSITLGNINLLDKNHNLFTTSSSCSLNKLSELENRNFDYFSNFNNLKEDDHLVNEKTDHHLNKFELPVTYSNIPNEFAAKQQSMNQANVKTALVSCLSIRMF